MSKQDNYQIITDRIIEALEAGIVPWRQPWDASAAGALRNAISNRAYSGINVPILTIAAHTAGYTDPRWLTFKQARDAGGSVRKGEKATPIVFWAFVEKDDRQNPGERATIPILRRWSVFNVSQCDGLTLPSIEQPRHDWTPIEAAERIVSGFEDAPTIAHDGGSRAYYRPATDTIHLPQRDQFHHAHGYYSTLFHEMGHSTGHISRLNRHGLETGIAPFGSDTYSREELAAEFTAAFLAGEAGIVDMGIEQNAAYVASWLKVLRDDKRLAITAASQAQRAADYILGRTREDA